MIHKQWFCFQIALKNDYYRLAYFLFRYSCEYQVSNILIGCCKGHAVERTGHGKYETTDCQGGNHR